MYIYTIAHLVNDGNGTEYIAIFEEGATWEDHQKPGYSLEKEYEITCDVSLVTLPLDRPLFPHN